MTREKSDGPLDRAKRVIAMPFTLAAALYRWLRRVARPAKTDKELRTDDATRQSQVRRGLRGLPPDHVQEPAKRR